MSVDMGSALGLANRKPRSLVDKVCRRRIQKTGEDVEGVVGVDNRTPNS